MAGFWLPQCILFLMDFGLVHWSGAVLGRVCALTCLFYPQFSEEQRFNSFLEALREKVEIKQLNHFWEIVVQGKMVLFSSFIDAT